MIRVVILDSRFSTPARLIPCDQRFFLSAGEVQDDYEPHHTSFNVDDFDSELKGHIYLEKKGWQLYWGVG